MTQRSTQAQLTTVMPACASTLPFLFSLDPLSIHYICHAVLPPLDLDLIPVLYSPLARLIPQVVRLGFEKEALIESIRSRLQNKATVTYYLLVDNRRGVHNSSYLREALNEGSHSHGPGGVGSGLAHLGPGGGGVQHPAQQQQHHHPLQGPMGGSSSSSSGAGGPGSHLPQQRLVAERKWRLGSHLKGHPSALMAELYRAMAVSGGAGLGEIVGHGLQARALNGR